MILASAAAEAIAFYVVFGLWQEGPRGSRARTAAGFILFVPPLFALGGLFELITGRAMWVLADWWMRTFPEAQRRRIGCLMVFLLGAIAFAVAAFLARRL